MFCGSSQEAKPLVCSPDGQWLLVIPDCFIPSDLKYSQILFHTNAWLVWFSRGNSGIPPRLMDSFVTFPCFQYQHMGPCLGLCGNNQHDQAHLMPKFYVWKIPLANFLQSDLWKNSGLWISNSARLCMFPPSSMRKTLWLYAFSLSTLEEHWTMFMWRFPSNEPRLIKSKWANS